MLTKKDLDARLKADAEVNRFKIDGDYIIFDNKSNLSYQVLESFKLKELLTANPVSTTKLNKNLLVALNNIRETYGREITIRSTYHSPEYHLTSFGAHDSDLYTTGNALSLGVDTNHVDELVKVIKEVSPMGELFIYKWGVHIGNASGSKEADFRTDTTMQRKVKDVISNDKMKNILILGGAAAAAWFFFFRKN